MQGPSSTSRSRAKSALPESEIQPPGLIEGRFQLEGLIAQDGAGSRYAARDLVLQTPVVVRFLPPEASAPTTLLRLQHEAEARRAETILSSQAPIGVGVLLGRVWIARPYAEGEPLSTRLSNSGPLTVLHALRVVRAVASTLHAAHAVGILHGSVRAPNVILHEDEAILVDTGHARSLALHEDDHTLWARAAYFSPEQLGLTEGEVDERSDLYSLGILVFETLSGRKPFVHTDLHELLRDHLATRPPSLRAIGVKAPRVVDELTQRLLRKDPRERYQTALAVVKDLDEVIARLERGEAEPSVPLGAHDRRATLAEPAFVERPTSTDALSKALGLAAQGQGGVMLLEAQSGAGKTRVLAEFAHAARNALVLHGQGVDQAAQRPFQILQGVTSGLVRVLREDATFAARFDAAVGDERSAIEPVAPDLATLLTVSAHEDLGPEAHGERRTVKALSHVLEASGTPDRPALIILDDCQWADEASIKLLRAWSRGPSPSTGRFVLIVAAFRTEEVDAAHPLRKCEAVAHVELEPFGRADVTKLAFSMAGPLPRTTLDTIATLADGSPFMASAVLRGLVEGGAIVPSPNGWVEDALRMREMHASQESAGFLARRLGLLPVDSLRALKVGAVLGKEFEASLASELLEAPASRVTEALDVARQRHIVWLRLDAGKYAFVHDKLREALLGMMTPEERRALHARAALILERSLRERAFDIAYHFDRAGDARSALPFALESAESARKHHSLALAEEYYRIALRGVDPNDRSTRAKIEEGLGDVLMLRGRYDEARASFEAAQTLSTTPIAKAQILAKAGELAFKRGDVKTASETLESALETLGRPAPRTTFGYLLRAAFEGVVQLLHSLFPRLFLQRRDAPDEVTLVAIRTYSRLAYAYWFQKGLVACGWAHLREMNLAERYKPGAEVAQAYSEHAPVMTMIPYHKRGLAYAERSLEIRRGLNDVWGMGQSLHFIAVAEYAASRYDVCAAKSREAMRVLSKTGDMWEYNTAAWHLAYCHYRTGDLRQAIEQARAIHASALEIGDVQSEGISLGIWAKAANGDVPSEVVARALANPSEDIHTRSEVLTASAILSLRAGRPADAVNDLEKAWRLIRAKGLRQEYVTPVLPWLSTALRARLATETQSQVAYNATVARGLKVTRTALWLSRSYKNNLPHALRERGMFLSIAGQGDRAIRLLMESVSTARTQGAPHEAALSLVALHEISPGAVSLADLAEAKSLLATQHEGTSHEKATLSLYDRFHSLMSEGRGIVAALGAENVARSLEASARALLRAETTRVVGAEEAGVEILSRVEKQQASVVIGPTDAASDGILARFAARNLLLAPIRPAGELTAVLVAANITTDRPFREEERHLADFLCTLASAALENAGGFDKLRMANERLSFQKVLLERQGEASIDGMLVVSPEGKILSSNRRFAEIWHLSSADMESDEKALGAVTHMLEDPDEFLRRVRELYAHPDEESREEVRLKDGRVIDRYSAPISGHDGVSRARVWFFRDVTQTKNAEKRLLEMNEQLQQVSSIKTLLLNTASHELNTPLTPMKIQIHLLEEGKFGPLDDRQQRAVATLSRNIDRLSQLVNDLLDVSKIQSGRLKLEKQPTDIAALVEETRGAFEETAREAGIEVRVNAAHVNVAVDPQRITQVLFNLVSNALKFTPPPGVVEVNVETRDSEVLVSVHDSGAGLTPDQVTRLFQPFSQVHDPMKFTKAGSGLGLYISKGIIEEHGGKIWCESTGPGVGSTFSFILPIGA
ncbi:MAG: ATP-binding protein [Thermoplasmatota archaeon]